MSDHKFILNTFKMYFDVNKEPLNQHTKELLDMVDLGINPIASEYNLKKQKEQAHADFETVRGEEQKVLNAITEKYGPGTLDPNTGVFTPSDT